MAKRKRSLFKLPRRLLSIKGNDSTLWIILGIAGAGALWYFGINESTRKFDLLGGLGGGQPQDTIINGNEVIPDMNPIDVVNDVQPSNAPPLPEMAEESQMTLSNTVSGAYVGRAYNARFSSDDIIPRTISGVD
ncbi:MAG: hypothetical protein R3321_02525 [Nitrososphaeraceae archaeon]|nr:hypothetical protein [Nitrososphaeraceae archaeon]